MLTQTDLATTLANWQAAKPGVHAVFRPSDTLHEVELRVTDHEARWSFSRADHDSLRDVIDEAGINFYVRATA